VIVSDRVRVEKALTEAQLVAMGEHCAALGLSRWTWHWYPAIRRLVVDQALGQRFAAHRRAGADEQEAGRQAAIDLGLQEASGASFVRALRRLRAGEPSDNLSARALPRAG